MSESSGLPDQDEFEEKFHLSPDKASINNNIKERLNLHVKRRLQQDFETSEIASSRNILQSTKKANDKVRKPYVKKSEKNIASTSSSTSNLNTKTKKCKLKEVGGKKGTSIENHSPQKASNLSKNNSGDLSCAGDDEGSHDGSSLNQDSERQAAFIDKEKCPDLLNLVLSAKKRDLFHNTEVIEFIQKITNVLKN